MRRRRLGFRRVLLLATAVGGLCTGALRAQAETSHLDYSARFDLRTYPFATYARGDLGYGWVVWGETPGAADAPSAVAGGDGPESGGAPGGVVSRPRDSGGAAANWQYGFVRPSLILGTIGVVNSVEGRLDFFPISIAGFTLGHSSTWRSWDSFGVDCRAVACRGRLDQQYVGAQAGAGVDRLFFAAFGRLDFMRVYEGGIAPVLVRDRPFLDGNTRLQGRPGGDRMATASALIGYPLMPWLKGLFLFTHSEMVGTVDRLNSAYVIAQWERAPWQVALGAGAFESRMDPFGFSVGLRLGWEGRDAVGLL